MNTNLTTLNRLMATTLLATLAACGGGGSGGAGLVALPTSGSPGSTSGSPATNPPMQPSVISGTAATGAALANASVSITDSSGNSPCQETSITTTALGSYTCTLKSGATAPFFIVVTDPTGNTAPLVSIATSTPAAGAALTVNATPLTTAILAQLAPDGNALTLANSRTIDVAALTQATANIVAQLANVLNTIGAPAGYDPFSTSITAATASGTGNTADMLLDVVKIVTDPATGKLALSTVDNPTPYVLATATAPGSTLAPPSAGVSALSQATSITAQAFTTCFALPTAQRVLGKDDTVPASLGGPQVNSVAASCQQLAATTSNGAGINFLHNGYAMGQLLYGILTSDTMTGAQFSVPEIMAFYPGSANSSGQDEAVLNIKYIDASGNPGNVVTLARFIPNTATSSRPTNWWLVGNQQPVDVSLKLQVRRVEQLNSANTNTTKASTFQTGIQVNVNAKGPGSTSGTGNLTFARISGPGLPGNGAAGTGLVYVLSNGAQSSMDLYSKTGSLTTGSQCGNGTTYNCPNLWFARTKGITGTGATTLTANPTGFVWAQSADGVDPSKVIKGAKYKVELFYGTNTGTADITIQKTLLSDLVQATQAVNLPWNTPGSQTLSALDPNGALTGAQSALTVDWVQNASAQQIASVQAVTDTTSGGYGPMKAVPRGATSVVLDNQKVPPLSTTNNVGRTLNFSYKMLDTSIKTAAYTYN